MSRQSICRASLPSVEAGTAAVWILHIPCCHVPVAVCTEMFEPLHPGIPTAAARDLLPPPVPAMAQAGVRALWSCD